MRSSPMATFVKWTFWLHLGVSYDILNDSISGSRNKFLAAQASGHKFRDAVSKRWSSFGMCAFGSSSSTGRHSNAPLVRLERQYLACEQQLCVCISYNTSLLLPCHPSRWWYMCTTFGLMRQLHMWPAGGRSGKGWILFHYLYFFFPLRLLNIHRVVLDKFASLPLGTTCIIAAVLDWKLWCLNIEEGAQTLCL